MRVLRRLRIPTLIFVNKIDRMGAGYEHLLTSIAERLSPAIIPMGTVSDLGEREAAWIPNDLDEPVFAERITALLADYDDELLAVYVTGQQLAGDRLQRALADQSRRALVHPVFFGSAITGTGLASLTAAIRAVAVRGRRPRRCAGRYGFQDRAWPGRGKGGLREDVARHDPCAGPGPSPAGREPGESHVGARVRRARGRAIAPLSRARSAACTGCTRPGSAT